MLTRHTPRTTAILGIVVLTAAGLGCASKGYVAQSIEPIDARVGEVEGRSTQNQEGIAKLETDVSRVEERAIGADSKAEEASRQAQDARQRADQAGESAGEARGLAEKGLGRVDGLEKTVANLDNYELLATKSVLFGLNKSDLTDEGRSNLDQAAAGLQGRKNYVIEVKGYTDSSGNPQHNLRLSQRRAETVVRYLNVEHKVPLFRITVLGVGEAEPSADNESREGREQNRRVEVRLFAAGSGSASLQAKTATQ